MSPRWAGRGRARLGRAGRAPAKRVRWGTGARGARPCGAHPAAAKDGGGGAALLDEGFGVAADVGEGVQGGHLLVPGVQAAGVCREAVEVLEGGPQGGGSERGVDLRGGEAQAGGEVLAVARAVEPGVEDPRVAVGEVGGCGGHRHVVVRRARADARGRSVPARKARTNPAYRREKAHKPCRCSGSSGSETGFALLRAPTEPRRSALRVLPHPDHCEVRHGACSRTHDLVRSGP